MNVLDVEFCRLEYYVYLILILVANCALRLILNDEPPICLLAHYVVSSTSFSTFTFPRHFCSYSIKNKGGIKDKRPSSAHHELLKNSNDSNAANRFKLENCAIAQNNTL